MINIRIATVEDVKQIYEMCLLFNGSKTKTSLQGVKDYLRKKEAIICVAQIEDKLVGFITGIIENNLSFGLPIGNISEVFVKVEFRQQGVATKMFEQMEQEFSKKAVNRFRVFTTVDNINAVNFYKSQSYQPFNTVMFRKDG